MGESVSNKPEHPGRYARIAQLLIAFEVVEFRWLWLSNLFSSMAMPIRMLSQGWLVLEMTNSPFWVGLIAGLQGLALVMFGVLGGAVVDRLDKRIVLAVVHFGSFSVASIVGMLVIFSDIKIWHLMLSAVLQGLFMATQLPASNTLAYQLVGPARLMNAMAARLAGMNLTRLIGSLIAGTLIATYGVGVSYIVAGVSSLIGAILLVFVRGDFSGKADREQFFHAVKVGLGYVWNNNKVRQLLLLSAVVEAFGFAHLVMIPVIARDVLQVGPIELGYLSAASGLGSTISTVTIACLGDFKKKGSLLVFTVIMAGITLIIFGFSPWFSVSLVFAGLAGGFLMAYDVTMGTVLQLMSEDEMRGRVLGIYGLTFGFTPLGGFVAGSMATIASPSLAVAFGGCVIFTYVAYLRKDLRDVQ